MSIEYKLRHDWYIHANDKEKTYMFQEKNRIQAVLFRRVICPRMMWIMKWAKAKTKKYL